MSNPTIYGLVQEHSLVKELWLADKSRLEKRGATQARIDTYSTNIDAMKVSKSSSVGTRSDKKQSAVDEKKARGEALIPINKFRTAAKDVFGAKSPKLKEFSVGVTLTNSTPKMLEAITNIKNGWTKYQSALMEEGGILEEDYTELLDAEAALTMKDTAQEVKRKKEAPEMTTAVKKAMAAAVKQADFIHGKAEIEFAKEKDKLKQWKAARKLRYAKEKPGDDEKPPETGR
ncbi:MAG: hypothetical protein HY960_01500 [Ignavibacteriae bacterium]|nr:hypothetical protein [Ignavibacteriota bacterium]